MDYQNIIVEKKDEGIIQITLNRPEALNALNSALFTDLRHALLDVQGDESVAVVILTGAGRAFCVGRDLKADAEFSAENFFENYYLRAGTFSLLEHLGPPVIAAVNGFAITGGLELVMCCDMVLASDRAMFRDTHAQVGIYPGAGSSQRLPRLLGEKRAKELLFASRFITAQEAERIGLVNRVVPHDKLLEEALCLAQDIAAQPRDVIRGMKRLIDAGMGMDYKSAIMLEQMESLASQVMVSGEDFAARNRGVIERGRGQVKKKQG